MPFDTPARELGRTKPGSNRGLVRRDNPVQGRFTLKAEEDRQGRLRAGHHPQTPEVVSDTRNGDHAFNGIQATGGEVAGKPVNQFLRVQGRVRFFQEVRAGDRV